MNDEPKTANQKPKTAIRNPSSNIWTGGVIGTLRPLLARYRWLLAAMVGLGFLAALSEGIGLSLFIPLFYSIDQGGFGPEGNDWLGRFLQRIFDAAPASDRFVVIALCIFGLLLVKNGLVYANGLLYSRMYARAGHFLRTRLSKQLLDVELSYLERSESGTLLNTLKKESWEALDAMAMVATACIQLCTIVVFTTLLLMISWPLTLLVAVALVVISSIVQWMTRRVKSLSQDGVRTHERLSQRILELFRGMWTIRAFGRTSFEYVQFSAISDRLSGIHFDRDKLAHLISPVSEVLVAALLLVIFFTTLRGPNELPVVLTFVVILYRLYPHVKELDKARFKLKASIGPVTEVINLLDRRDKPYLRAGSTAFEGIREAITFDGVSFRYEPGDPPALRDVSVRIPKGKMMALVGPSGAGKSTFMKLMLRFYDPTGGTIYVDDRPLPELDLASWRQRLSVVSQEVHVFNQTIRQNIAYGRLDATEEEVVAAARQAHAHDFIVDLPDGYDTNVGDRGVRLSAGQKQRIALARAIVRDPELFILDEATNALDSMTERAVQESLEQLRQDRTVVVIAHRLATIERADLVLVLDRGTVVEQGTIAELLQNQALFARMYALQHSEAVSNADFFSSLSRDDDA